MSTYVRNEDNSRRCRWWLRVQISFQESAVGSVLCNEMPFCSGLTCQATASPPSEKNSRYYKVIARSQIWHAWNIRCTTWDYSSNHHGLCVSVLDLAWWLWYFRSEITTISFLYRRYIHSATTIYIYWSLLVIHNLGKYFMICFEVYCKIANATNHENLHLDDYVVRVKCV